MYHCYFLINYIGPPKVFSLSFGPLSKKFAHHWRLLGQNIHIVTTDSGQGVDVNTQQGQEMNTSRFSQIY